MRRGPPLYVAPDRLFRRLLRSPRAVSPTAVPIAGAPGTSCVCAIHPLDEADAIERHAGAPDALRLTLVAAELTALALHEGDARAFADGTQLLRLLTERDAMAVMRATLAALDTISPSFRRIDEDAWVAHLAEGAKTGGNAEQAIALALCVEGNARTGIPRPEWYFGLPAGQLTDGQRLAFRAARRAVFDEER